MSVWVGTDLVFVPTFAEQLAMPGSRFAEVFTAGERRDCRARADEVASLAARWAAKEALVKAWSASLWGRPPVVGEQVHREIEVECDAWGRPRLRLHGEAAEHLANFETSVSLTHDGHYASATVLLAQCPRVAQNG